METALELISDTEQPKRITLTELLEDYLERTRTQIEPATARGATYGMKDFVAAVGDIYADRVTYKHCERFHQYCVFSKQEFDRILTAARSPIWKVRILLAKTAGLRKDELTYEMCKCPDCNFGRGWRSTFEKAGIEAVAFRDLRSTCITEWFEQGLLPHEVQKLAGHADIRTTMKYYVGIRESLIGRARGASSAALGGDFSAHCVRGAQSGENGKDVTSTSPCAQAGYGSQSITA